MNVNEKILCEKCDGEMQIKIDESTCETSIKINCKVCNKVSLSAIIPNKLIKDVKEQHPGLDLNKEMIEMLKGEMKSEENYLKKLKAEILSFTDNKNAEPADLNWTETSTQV